MAAETVIHRHLKQRKREGALNNRMLKSGSTDFKCHYVITERTQSTQSNQFTAANTQDSQNLQKSIFRIPWQSDWSY